MKPLSKRISAWLADLMRTPVVRSAKVFVPKRLRQACWNLVLRADEFRVMGSRMFIPAEARQRDLVLDCYEPGVSACLRRLLRPGMLFCDVGANIGVFTLLAARQVGPQGRVFSFEPGPENFAVLTRNVEANLYANVVCVQKAVAQYNGTSRLFLSRFCGSHSLVGEPAEHTGQSLDVETVRLDSVPGLERIDVLKVDVEGAELEVLESLGSLRPQVILEYNAERLSRKGLNLSTFQERIRALGYTLTNIDSPEVDLDSLAGRKEITINLLASPTADN
jgi:FkbM family methyltransferase